MFLNWPQLLKTRATMAEFNISVDAAPAVMHFLTLQTERGRDRGDPAADSAPRVRGRLEASGERRQGAFEEAAFQRGSLNSGAWKILASAKPEALLYLDVTGRNKTVDEKIKNFLGKWRQVQETDSVCADGRAAHYAAAAGVSRRSARRRSCCCWMANCVPRARS